MQDRRTNAQSSTATLSTEAKERSMKIYSQNVVWNTCDSTPEPLADAEYLSKIRRSGVTAINHTVVYSVGFKEAVRAIAKWSCLYDANPDIGFIARTIEDIEAAGRDRRAAVFMGFQDITALEEDLVHLDTFHQLGIRFVQPTYQDRNIAGDGCGERYQSGLSNFGARLVERCNKLGIVVDVSHLGKGSTLDAIELSEVPVMATHCGVKALTDTPRNKSDEEIRALAARGGIIGIAAKSGFLRPDGLQCGSNVDDLVDHVAYVAELVGIDHVCIGTDISDDRGYTVERMGAFHRKHPEVAIIGPDLLIDRMNTDEIGAHSFYPICEGLVARGFSDEEIAKILGLNTTNVLKSILH